MTYNDIGYSIVNVLRFAGITKVGQMSQTPVVLFVGLIGAGKSTVLNVFKEKGAAILLTDNLWKEKIYQECNRERLIEVLGEDVLHADGSPNLKRLRSLLFSLDVDEQATCILRQKNLFLEFGETFFQSLRAEIDVQVSKPGVTIVVVENALALTNGWDKKIDPTQIVSVHCPKDVRLTRVLNRNPSVNESTYLATMSMQPSDEEHFTMSSAVGAIHLSTHCSVEETIARSIKLYERLIGL